MVPLLIFMSPDVESFNVTDSSKPVLPVLREYGSDHEGSMPQWVDGRRNILSRAAVQPEGNFCKDDEKWDRKEGVRSL